jgi:hypothetical protein
MFMFKMGGYNPAQIAEMYGISRAAVYQTLYRFWHWL